MVARRYLLALLSLLAIPRGSGWQLQRPPSLISTAGLVVDVGAASFVFACLPAVSACFERRTKSLRSVWNLYTALAMNMMKKGSIRIADCRKPSPNAKSTVGQKSRTQRYVEAERMRVALYQSRVDTPVGQLQIAASVGVASMNRDSTTLDSLLERADKALYKAKRQGRNRVEAWML